MPRLSPRETGSPCSLSGPSPRCGSTGPDDDFDGVTINMTTDLLFAPADVTIDPGTSVRWVARRRSSIPSPRMSPRSPVYGRR